MILYISLVGDFSLYVFDYMFNKTGTAISVAMLILNELNKSVLTYDFKLRLHTTYVHVYVSATKIKLDCIKS